MLVLFHLCFLTYTSHKGALICTSFVFEPIMCKQRHMCYLLLHRHDGWSARPHEINMFCLVGWSLEAVRKFYFLADTWIVMQIIIIILLCRTVTVLNIITAPLVNGVHQGFPLAHEHNHNSVSLFKQWKAVGETTSVCGCRKAGVSLIYCRQTTTSLSFHVAWFPLRNEHRLFFYCRVHPIAFTPCRTPRDKWLCSTLWC